MAFFPTRIPFFAWMTLLTEKLARQKGSWNVKGPLVLTSCDSFMARYQMWHCEDHRTVMKKSCRNGVKGRQMGILIVTSFSRTQEFPFIRSLSAISIRAFSRVDFKKDTKCRGGKNSFRRCFVDEKPQFVKLVL